jgi:hypothetical protein
MTRALPTRQRIHRAGTSNNRTTISLAAELGIKKPDAPIVAIDLGTLFNKDSYLDSDETAYVEKVENFLTEVESQPRSSSKKLGSFSQRNRRSPKSDLIVTWQGKSYALGKQGIIAGGQTNLDGDKTDELEIILRVLFALTLYELGKKTDEEVYLTLAIPFLNQKDFNRKEAKIRAAIGEALSWGTIEGMRSVRVKALKVDPEDYHAELFSRLFSTDSPNFEDEERATIGLGFRTCNFGLIAADGYYDDVRSKSFEGKGTSLFYEWVANDIGLKQWNNAQFIQALNTGADYFRPQGSDEELELAEAVELARGWYVSEIQKLVKKHTPSEVERFVICGGGALKFGEALIERLWGQAVTCPEADIANSIGQLIEMALEI